LAIQTRVLEFKEEIVNEAIRAELAREGQVYLVHNRVQTIAAVAEMVERLVPHARVAVAHGQMDEHDLEQVMQSFTEGRFDVLVSTVIIESGLDIPNVNTLIVNRADTFGLAQLYQLRGRVGRSSVQAYAYLLTPPFGYLKDDALRRLKVLEQFTDLGSGFQIAMRDLEIRGAGNLLGTEQHGFIAAVGFELYTRLLRETMQTLKDGTSSISIDPKMDLQEISAFLPETYIEDREQRISVYQKISQKETVEELKEMETELNDRFGEVPQEVRSLLAIMSMKIVAKKFFIGRVIMKLDRLVFEFAESHEPNQKELGLIVEKIKRPFEFIYGHPLKISIELTEIDPVLKLQQARRVMEGLT
jgi:transcription-repair coupling factor (superfamily II helicase)